MEVITFQSSLHLVVNVRKSDSDRHRVSRPDNFSKLDFFLLLDPRAAATQTNAVIDMVCNDFEGINKPRGHS